MIHHRVRCSLKPPPPTPWLVLPPEERAYKFYSVSEDRVLTLKKKEDGTAVPPRDALLRGSSHGWLALFDEESNRVFLSDPISGRHLRLPPSTYRSPIILSGSPDDDQECYASQYESYCAVVGATEWTKLAAYEEDESLIYGDLAYCSSRGALSIITPSGFEFDSVGVRVKYDGIADHQIDVWDLRSNSKVETTWFWKFRGPPHYWKENEDGEFLTRKCWQVQHLVYAGDGDSPLIVVRFLRLRENSFVVLERDGKDGSIRVVDDFCENSTAGFVVLEIDGKDRSIRVVDDLKGLALFVGMNHSFAIPATGTGMLKPNSIYFAPILRNSKCTNIDVGIFDYQNKTFSYFDDKLQLGNSPMWFTPNSP